MTPTKGKDARDQQVRRFVRQLSREERMLVVLKRNLYEGDWDGMVADLKARLEGKPYIFRLASRITDDLERIERLRNYEEKHKVNIGDYVEME